MVSQMKDDLVGADSIHVRNAADFVGSVREYATLPQLRIAIKRNKPVYFGRIEVRGNTKTRDKVIRRELEIEEHKLFSETLLERTRAWIGRFGSPCVSCQTATALPPASIPT